MASTLGSCESTFAELDFFLRDPQGGDEPSVLPTLPFQPAPGLAGTREVGESHVAVQLPDPALRVVEVVASLFR